ncbi:transcriptional regulator [Streptomyces sp. NPDC056437]|uniref:transcriptional regulator n=1 Tax=Streptomyces sp. NPDC056437 TaxID=3345816 RepID=UPI0036BEE138
MELWLAALGLVASLGGGYVGWRALDRSAVEKSTGRFLRERADIYSRYGELSELSADMHIERRPALTRVGGSALLWDDTMRPPAPVPLRQVRSVWENAPRPADRELLAAATRTLPLQTKGSRYQRYSHALGDLKRPSLFEDRVSFRLLEADWCARSGPLLVFGEGHYFDLVDQNEAVAHELAAATEAPRRRRPSWRRLPMRAALSQDPLSLHKRNLLPSIGTLTIRRTPDGRGTFFLLRRGGGQVATGERTYGVLPAGMFQPASLSPLGYRRDLDIWRSVMREYNEEMLGAEEATGTGGQEVDYTAAPYGDLDRALSDGTLRVWCFGMGLEPLNLAVCLLTVAVFEASVFDSIFAGMVRQNEEGVIISGPSRHGAVEGLPLDEEAVRDLPRLQISPPAAGLLHLALEHRNMLLSDPDV